MDGRERVIRTLEFNSPDRLPVDLWVLPSARSEHGEELDKLLSENETDIALIDGPCDVSFNKTIYEVGRFTDEWGCEWTSFQAGIIGEVKNSPVKNAADVNGYTAPTVVFNAKWEETLPFTSERIRKARTEGKFVIGGWMNPFERMQFLRGPEDLYCDLYYLEDATYKLRDVVKNFYLDYLDKWLGMDIDAVAIGDDWGSQRALLVSPQLWVKFFKPMYKELCDKIISRGKYVFFHSDGYIFDIYQHLVDLGVKAVNSQLWCMGVEKVAAQYAGKITFWGEISRQNILPSGSADDVKEAARTMRSLLYVNGGGFIGQSEVGKDVPLANIEAVLKAWA